MNYRFQFRRYRLPLRVPVRTAHGLWMEREGVIVRLENESGGAGYGEAAVIPWFGTETVEEAETACRELSEHVDDARLASVPARLAALRNAIASARWEAGRGVRPPSTPQGDKGRADGPPYLPVAALLPSGRAVLAEIAPKAEAGFRTFKWKVGVGDAADELALLDDVCAALPDGAKLRLDANGAWDRRTAERWLERSAERPVEFVEQPCFAGAGETTTRRERSDDLLRGLAESFPTPIALDESIASEGDVERWLALGWRGIFVVKPSLLGDATAALEKLAAAKADVVFSSALETVVGARAALRRAFAWKPVNGAAGSTHSANSGQAGSPQARALGFGVWPLFADARFDGPHTAAFLRLEDVERLNPEVLWNALS